MNGDTLSVVLESVCQTVARFPYSSLEPAVIIFRTDVESDQIVEHFRQVGLSFEQLRAGLHPLGSYRFGLSGRLSRISIIFIRRAGGIIQIDGEFRAVIIHFITIWDRRLPYVAIQRPFAFIVSVARALLPLRLVIIILSEYLGKTWSVTESADKSDSMTGSGFVNDIE